MSIMFGGEEERKTANLVGYISAGCTNCGRWRLELFVEGGEKAVGIQCEKCFYRWPLDKGSGTPSGNIYGGWEID
jgi:hypothetical protein